MSKFLFKVNDKFYLHSQDDKLYAHNDPFAFKTLLVDGDFKRFRTELGYGNRRDITGTDFGVLFNDDNSTWTATNNWDTLNENNWEDVIWRDTNFEITFDNLDGIDLSEVGLFLGGTSLTSSGGPEWLRISYTPISTGIKTTLVQQDTNHTNAIDYIFDLYELMTNAGLTPILAVGDKIQLLNEESSLNRFVISVKETI